MERPVSIRAVTSADAEAIGHVHFTASRETYPGLLPPQKLAALSAEARVKMWKRALEHPLAADTAVYAAEHDGGMIGFGACSAQRSGCMAALGYDAEIISVYVLRAFQRCGVGRRLMQHMALALQSRRYSAVSLWALRTNEVACRFYESRGGVIVAEKYDERPEGVLVAYGWLDLHCLAADTSSRSIGDETGSKPPPEPKRFYKLLPQ